MTRNEEIYMAHMAGAKYEELAEKYGLSVGRITKICNRYQEIVDQNGCELYDRIHELVDDPNVAGKIYGILSHRKNGITTIEAVRGLTENDLKKMRNCGERMVEVLKNV